MTKQKIVVPRRIQHSNPLHVTPPTPHTKKFQHDIHHTPTCPPNTPRKATVVNADETATTHQQHVSASNTNKRDNLFVRECPFFRQCEHVDDQGPFKKQHYCFNCAAKGLVPPQVNSQSFLPAFC